MPALTEIESSVQRLRLGMRSAATFVTLWIQPRADAVDRTEYELDRRRFRKLGGRKAHLTLGSLLALDLFMPPGDIANIMLGSIPYERCAERAARLLEMRGEAGARAVIDGLFVPENLRKVLDGIGRGSASGLRLPDPLDRIEIDGDEVELDDGVHDDPAVADAVSEVLAENVRDGFLALTELLDMLDVSRIVEGQLNAANGRFGHELFDPESRRTLAAWSAAVFVSRSGLGRLFNVPTLAWLEGLLDRLAREETENDREVTLADASHVAMADVPTAPFRIYGRLGSVYSQILRLDDVATPEDAMILARSFADNGEAEQVEASRDGTIDWGAYEELAARNRAETPAHLVEPVGWILQHLAQSDTPMSHWSTKLDRLAREHGVEVEQIEEAYDALLGGAGE